MVEQKGAYFYIHIAPHNRHFLRFAFEGVVCQYADLPFALSPALRTFPAHSPLRQMLICILNYLDDWLMLARSERELVTHRVLLECLGLKINLQKSQLSLRQQAVFLQTNINSAQM